MPTAIYDNPLFHEKLQEMYNRPELREIHMGVADKFLFKQVALEEIERLILDPTLSQQIFCRDHSAIDLAIFSGVADALKSYGRAYLNDSNKHQ
jgi:hypothetical protein